MSISKIREQPVEQVYIRVPIPVRTFVYCRVSTQSQNDKYRVSFETQKDAIREFTNERGLRIFREESEVGSAYGKKDAKRNLWKTIVDLKNCVFIVYDATRFSRNVEGAKKIFSLFAKNNVTVIFVKSSAAGEHIIVPPGGDTLVALTDVTIAQNQSKLLGEKIRRTNELKRKKGYFVGGAAPYGWKKIVKGDGKVLASSEYELKVQKFISYCLKKGIHVTTLNKLMRAISENFDIPISCYDKNNILIHQMSEILTFQEIADLLNDYGVTKRGKQWSASMAKTGIKKLNEFNFDDVREDEIVESFEYSMSVTNVGGFLEQSKSDLEGSEALCPAHDDNNNDNNAPPPVVNVPPAEAMNVVDDEDDIWGEISNEELLKELIRRKIW